MRVAFCSASPFNRTNGGLRNAQECDTRFRLTVALMRAPFYRECISDSVAGNGKRERIIESRARAISSRRPAIYPRSDSSLPRGDESAFSKSDAVRSCNRERSRARWERFSSRGSRTRIHGASLNDSRSETLVPTSYLYDTDSSNLRFTFLGSTGNDSAATARNMPRGPSGSAPNDATREQAMKPELANHMPSDSRFSPFDKAYVARAIPSDRVAANSLTES